MLRSLVPGSCALILLAATVAGQCGGNGGAGDLVSDPFSLGSTATVTLSGPAGLPFGLWISDSIAPVPIPGVGSVCLNLASPAFQLLLQGTVPGSGRVDLPVPIPNDPNLLSVVIYGQGAVIGGGSPGGVGLTPTLRVDFENPDSYVTLPSLATPRALATTTLMGDGRVLIAGGGGGTVIGPVGSASTEIYDPVTRSFGAGPAMGVQRAVHTATALQDGRVLVTGGLIDSIGTITATCEIFDPYTDTWSAAASMNSVRGGHNAVLLQDGRVFVAGGTTTFVVPMGTTNFANVLNSAVDTGEVYDPVADTWTPVSNTMASIRFLASTVVLPDGRAMVISGLDGASTVFGATIVSWTPTIDFYDPATNAFTQGPSMPSNRSQSAASTIVLDDGRVWVVGGAVAGALQIPTSTTATLLFDPSTGLWTLGPALPVDVSLPGVVRLTNGDVYVVGGVTGTLLAPGATGSAVTFDGTSLSPVSTLPAPRGAQATVGLKDGTVLIAGGGDATGAAQADAWLWFQ